MIFTLQRTRKGLDQGKFSDTIWPREEVGVVRTPLRDLTLQMFHGPLIAKHAPTHVDILPMPDSLLNPMDAVDAIMQNIAGV